MRNQRFELNISSSDVILKNLENLETIDQNYLNLNDENKSSQCCII